MKKNVNLFCAAALIGALCAAFVACNEPKETDPKKETNPWQGEEIPGMETHHATGTVIGKYSNGFGSLLVQVDAEYEIGEAVDFSYYKSRGILPGSGIYPNLIQVQPSLNMSFNDIVNKKISFSYRVFHEEKDRELFTVGLITYNDCTPPPYVPIFTITGYKIITN